jgi:hypothetical protein
MNGDSDSNTGASTAADTPATGGSNLGINATSANIAEPSDEAGTDVLPEAPLGLAEDLVDTGYLLIDGAGHLANDAYAGGDQIDDVSDVVTLNVRRLDLIRVESTTA